MALLAASPRSAKRGRRCQPGTGRHEGCLGPSPEQRKGARSLALPWGRERSCKQHFLPSRGFTLLLCWALVFPRLWPAAGPGCSSAAQRAPEEARAAAGELLLCKLAPSNPSQGVPGDETPPRLLCTSPSGPAGWQGSAAAAPGRVKRAAACGRAPRTACACCRSGAAQPAPLGVGPRMLWKSTDP